MGEATETIECGQCVEKQLFYKRSKKKMGKRKVVVGFKLIFGGSLKVAMWHHGNFWSALSLTAGSCSTRVILAYVPSLQFMTTTHRYG